MFSLLIVFTTGVVSGAQDTDRKTARVSADTWLALIDTESYDASWDTAALNS